MNDTLETLKRDGYCILDGFAKNQLPALVAEFDATFSSVPDRAHASLETHLTVVNGKNYEPGKHLRVLPSGYNKFPTLMKLFKNDQFRNLVNGYCGNTSNHMMQIFMSHEYHHCDSKDNWDRLNWLHFDPYPSLKFLLYLTDTNKENGASAVVPGSRSVGKHYREKKVNVSDLTGWQNGCKHRLEDWEENPQYTNADAVHAQCSAGSVLLLDTDVLHFGGLITKENLERKTVIVHNRPQGLTMPNYDKDS